VSPVYEVWELFDEPEVFCVRVVCVTVVWERTEDVSAIEDEGLNVSTDAIVERR
jgi:hypothetical protein